MTTPAVTQYCQIERTRLAGLLQGLQGGLSLRASAESVAEGIDISDWEDQELRELVDYRTSVLAQTIGQIDQLLSSDTPDFEHFHHLAVSESNLGCYVQAQVWLDLGAGLWDWEPPPYGVNFRVTSRCNLKCTHCFQEVRTPDGPFDAIRDYKDELSLEDYLTVFRKSEYLKSCGVCFSGSETYARKDIQQLFRGLADLGIHFDIGTNGKLPHRLRETLDDPHVSPFVDHVFFSIDGVGEVHDQIRGAGSYAPLMKAIDIAALHGKQIGRAAVACDSNLEALPELVSSFDNMLVLPQMRSAAHWQPRRKQLWQSAGKNNKQHYFHALDAGETGMGCVAGIGKCDIGPDGGVRACSLTEVGGQPVDFLMGRLQDFDLDFDALWRSDKAKAVRKAMRSCPGCGNVCARS